MLVFVFFQSLNMPVRPPTPHCFNKNASNASCTCTDVSVHMAAAYCTSFMPKNVRLCSKPVMAVSNMAASNFLRPFTMAMFSVANAKVFSVANAKAAVRRLVMAMLFRAVNLAYEKGWFGGNTS